MTALVVIALLAGALAGVGRWHRTVTTGADYVSRRWLDAQLRDRR